MLRERKLRARILLSIHDELVLEVRLRQTEACADVDMLTDQKG